MSIIDLPIVMVAALDVDVLGHVVSGGAIVVGAVLVMQTWAIYSKVAQNRNPSAGQLKLVQIIGGVAITFFVLAIVAEYMKTSAGRRPTSSKLTVIANAWPKDLLGGPIPGQVSHSDKSPQDLEIDDKLNEIEMGGFTSTLFLNFSRARAKYEHDLSQLRKQLDETIKKSVPLDAAKADLGVPKDL